MWVLHCAYADALPQMVAASVYRVARSMYAFLRWNTALLILVRLKGGVHTHSLVVTERLCGRDGMCDGLAVGCDSLAVVDELVELRDTSVLTVTSSLRLLDNDIWRTSV